MKEEPLFLLKYGEKVYMHSLITKGEVFLNTRKHYQDIEDMEIGDSWEAIDEIRQADSISISYVDKVHWETFAIDTPVGISYDWKPKGNVYCTYGVRLNHFDGQPLHIVPKEVECKFGDTIVLIHAKEFLNRIQVQLSKQGYSFESRFVQYYDPKEIDGKIDAFQKRDIFSHQSEYRIFVENDKDESIKITIGSIEDIAQICNDDMVKFELDGKDYVIYPSMGDLNPNDIILNDKVDSQQK